MKITRFIWLEQFSDKIQVKHRLTQEEVEQMFLNRARFEFEERGDILGEDIYRATGRTDAGRYLVAFFIYKHSGRALVISARDATKRERKRYAKKKSKTASKKVRDPLPEHFNSLEEAAEFWDTHDSADYDEYFKTSSLRSISNPARI